MENFNQDPEQNNPPPGEGLPQSNQWSSMLRSLIAFLLLLAVVTASFWISFQLGKRLFVSWQRPERKIDIEIPAPPAALQALQSEMSKESQALTLPATHEVKQLPVASKGQITATKKLPATSQMSVRKTSLKSAKTYPPKIASGTHYYKVQAGVFRDKTKAQALIERIAADGFDTYLKKVAADWRVQVGAFREKIEAKTLQDQLADKGFTSVVIYE